MNIEGTRLMKKTDNGRKNRTRSLDIEYLKSKEHNISSYKNAITALGHVCHKENGNGLVTYVETAKEIDEIDEVILKVHKSEDRRVFESKPENGSKEKLLKEYAKQKEEITFATETPSRLIRACRKRFGFADVQEILQDLRIDLCDPDDPRREMNDPKLPEYIRYQMYQDFFERTGVMLDMREVDIKNGFSRKHRKVVIKNGTN